MPGAGQARISAFACWNSLSLSAPSALLNAFWIMHWFFVYRALINAPWVSVS